MERNYLNRPVSSSDPCVGARETELGVGMDVVLSRFSLSPSDWCAGDRRQVLGVVTVAASLSLPSLSLPEV